VGWAYSQTSGRYCRADVIDIVLDRITDVVNDEILAFIGSMEMHYLDWCNRLGLNGLKGLYLALKKRDKVVRYDFPIEEVIEEAKRLGMTECKKDKETGSTKMYSVHSDEIKDWEHNFDKKKKITSALRRPLPNGQGNEIGMSCNIRALRHVVQLRTGAGAEWEIRYVYNQIYDIVKERFPTVFYKARTRVVEGLREVYGMRMQPFEITAGDPNALQFWEASQMESELARRKTA
jgi:thymidylate synthase ThyX